MAAARSTVKSTISRPGTRSLGGCGSCLVPRKMGLPLGLWLIGLVLGQKSTPRSAVGSKTVGQLQVYELCVPTMTLGGLLLHHWAEIPGWAGLRPRPGLGFLEPSHKAPSGSTARTKVSRPASRDTEEKCISCWVLSRPD